jgi:AmmeMemoRadiSam system protein B/AmmeMemoRadiSam system protein A
MLKKIIIIFCFGIINLLKGQDMLQFDKISHRPAFVAGSFYPGNEDSLKLKINEYLKLTDDYHYKNVDISGIVVPHAGYVYSGYIAGLAYRELIGKDYDLVIIISPSHTKYFKGSCIFNGDAYLTPLGPAWVDRDFCNELSQQYQSVYLGKDGHDLNNGRSEHALEVQLPFLQTVLPNTKIVPIVMGSQESNYVDDLMKSIYFTIKKTGKKVLIVASSDLSHFHDQKKSNELDSKVVKYFSLYDYFKIQYLINNNKTEACGAGPIISMMMTNELLGSNKAESLFYATSADSPEVSSDSSRVVGYFSGLVYKNKEEITDLPLLSDKQKEDIIKYVRKAIKNKINRDSIENYLDIELPSTYGTFVTIKKNDELRACMGHLFSFDSIQNELRSTAELASTEDYRFGPLKSNEIEQIKVEVTILSKFKRVLNPESVELGRHGLYIRQFDTIGKNYNSGLLLPQVAIEHSLTKKEFLESVCKKAGLNKDSYLAQSSELFIFESVIITENN